MLLSWSYCSRERNWPYKQKLALFAAIIFDPCCYNLIIAVQGLSRRSKPRNPLCAGAVQWINFTKSWITDPPQPAPEELDQRQTLPASTRSTASSKREDLSTRGHAFA